MRALVSRLLWIFASAGLSSSALTINAAHPDLRSELYRAVEQGDVQAARLLIEKGANPNAHREYQRQLFRLHGSSPHKNPENHKTVLMVAAERGDVEIAKMLLAAGADPNRKTRIEKTALMYAAERGHLQVMSLLLDAKADVVAVANESENCCGGDLSGSALRFAISYALRNSKDTRPALLLLGHMKGRRLPRREADRCLNLALQFGMPELATKIEAIGADRRRIDITVTP